MIVPVNINDDEIFETEWHFVVVNNTKMQKSDNNKKCGI